MARLDDLPRNVCVDAVREALRRGGPDLDRFTRTGFSDDDRCGARGRTNWSSSTRMVDDSTARAVGASPGSRSGWFDGEQWFRGVDGGVTKHLRVPGFERDRRVPFRVYPPGT